MKPIILTIANSDSSAGTGIQADLKTIASLNAYGVNAITGLVARNPQQTVSSQGVDEKFLKNQLEAIANDFDIDVVKIGQVYTTKQVDVINEFLTAHPEIKHVILDYSYNPHSLEDHKIIIKKMLDTLVHKISLITINNIEIQRYYDKKSISFEDFVDVAKKLMKQGAQNVLVKGGHIKDEEHAKDLFYNGVDEVWLDVKHVDGHNNYGAGCTLSAAIATYLGYGEDLITSISLSKKYLTRLLTFENELQKGRVGLIDHFR